jgi:hypothetical protein
MPVDAAIAGSTYRLAHLRPTAAIFHGDQEVDDQPLEKRRRHLTNAFEDVRL